LNIVIVTVVITLNSGVMLQTEKHLAWFESNCVLRVKLWEFCYRWMYWGNLLNYYVCVVCALILIVIVQCSCVKYSIAVDDCLCVIVQFLSLIVYHRKDSAYVWQHRYILSTRWR